MLKKYISFFRGCIGVLVLALHTASVGTSILLLTPFKLLLRIFRLDTKIIPLMRAPFHYWYKTMPFIFNTLLNIEYNIRLPKKELKPEQSSLIISNHQSWLDIPLMLALLKDHISSPTFFLKKELLYAPLIGSSAWAMDMIFVNRYSKKQLSLNPELSGKDMEVAKRKCRKLKNYPTSLINFCEGTRFTKIKHLKSNTELKNLLPPKAGGMNFSLNALEEKISHILNLTIVYHDNNGEKIMWDFLSGKIKKISLVAEIIPLSPKLFGDYHTDDSYREEFQEFVNSNWQDKDKLIDELKA